MPDRIFGHVYGAEDANTQLGLPRMWRSKFRARLFRCRKRTQKQTANELNKKGTPDMLSYPFLGPKNLLQE